MKVSHTLLITNISNVIVVNLFNILFLVGKQKSSDKSNQTQHALSACDKFSQRVTAHAAVTDVWRQTVQTIKVLILESSAVEMTGEMEIRRAMPRSHETWNNYYSFSFLTPLSSRMNGQQQWTWVAVMALLVLTAMAGEGGKAEKQGEASKILL